MNDLLTVCRELWVFNSQFCPSELNGFDCYSFQDNRAFDVNRECITENDAVDKLYNDLKGYSNSQRILVSNLIQDFGGLTSDTAQFKVTT